MSAEILPFPVDRAQAPRTCGRDDVIPFHVWPDDAEPGDHCACGSDQLPDHPVLQFHLEPRDPPDPATVDQYVRVMLGGIPSDVDVSELLRSILTHPE